MTPALVPDLLVGVLGGLIIAVLAVLVLQLRNQSKLTTLTYPAYEYALQQAEHDANEVVKKAHAQAREIITKAETITREDIAARQEKITSANDAYFKELEQLHVSMHRHLTQVAEAGVTSLTSASEEIAAHTKQQSAALKKFATATQSDWQGVIDQTTTTLDTHAAEASATIKKLIATATKELTSAQAEQRRALAEHMSTLMDEAKSEITEYRQQRQQLIDTHIADIVTDVTTEVLHTTLDSAQHATLARTALAAAKQDHLL